MKVSKNETPELNRLHSLADTAQVLRSGRMDLVEYVDVMCARVAEVDPRVEAMLPEPERHERRRFTDCWWPSKIYFTFPGM
jgi:hypothetical protein